MRAARLARDTAGRLPLLGPIRDFRGGTALCTTGDRLAGAGGAAPEPRSGQDGAGPPGYSPQGYRTATPVLLPTRATIALAAALGALASPGRADLVAAVGETTGQLALSRMLSRMKADAVGRRVLAARPRITAESMERAWAMPPDTFGGAYATFMGARRFEPGDRPPVRFIVGEEEAYVAARAREAHDFWHVLFGCGTTVLGELALKALEFVHTGQPVALLAAAVGPARLAPADRAAFAASFLPWALRAGLSCRDLMCIDYESRLEAPLEGLRRELGVLVAPGGTGFVKRRKQADGAR